MKGIFLLVSFVISLPLLAEEGMWTLDNLPKKDLKKKYNFSADSDWIKTVQLSSVRLANGCSGSFISKKGLVMTNHHCARGCIQQVSTAKNDYIANGFHAKNLKSEKTCPGLEINRLVDIIDVSSKITDATEGLKGKKYFDARKAKMSSLEKKCANGEETIRCDVVSLYHGGQYKLYKYRRYQDVKLVFAPEQAIASFGGDPDNFNFPRYSLDMTFLRVYEDGKPLDNKNYFKWSDNKVADGELAFISGHPGRTNRLLTIAELEYQRDVQLPDRLFKLSEMRGLLIEYQKRGKEQKRTSQNKLQGVENSFKALRGRLKSLQDKEFFAQLVKAEKDLKSRVASNRWYKKKYGDPWSKISKTADLAKDKKDELTYVMSSTFGSRLFRIARTLVRAADELPKANEKRLREFSDAKLPQMKQRLLSRAPIYKELETAMIEFELTKMREALSPDHPFVKKVLGKKSPAQVAKRLVRSTRLSKVNVRSQLLKGGVKAIQSSKDPMILMARLVDQDSRDMRGYYENNIEAVIDKNSEKIAKAKFDIFGTDVYPDATFSLRVSYGQVKGYKEKGKDVMPMTKVKGLYERQTGSSPFALPKTWEKSKSRLNSSTPFNFVTTNDIIGGNSGSPVLNKRAEIIGLVFDGNIHSLGGAYGFDEKINRAVSVHSGVIMESLEKVYQSKRILSEIEESRITTK